MKGLYMPEDIIPIKEERVTELWKGKEPDPQFGYTDLERRPLALAALALADEKARFMHR